MGKPDGNGLLGKRRDNIKMDLRELAWEGVSWVHFQHVRDEFQGSREDGNEPYVSLKCVIC